MEQRAARALGGRLREHRAAADGGRNDRARCTARSLVERRAGRYQGAAPERPGGDPARPRAARAVREQGRGPARLPRGDRRAGHHRATSRRRCAASSTSATRPPTSSACATVLAPFDRLDVPRRSRRAVDRTAARDAGGAGASPCTRLRTATARRAAGRQLLEAYYQQVLADGFFHADPHPGNLMWSDGTIYLLDLGMVGEVDAELAALAAAPAARLLAGGRRVPRRGDAVAVGRAG